MRAKTILTILLISALTVSSSCSQQKTEWKGTIEERDGVVIVKNPREPMYGSEILNIEEELSIGKGKNEKDYLFENVSDVAVDKENNIYVVDSKACMVRVFAENGIHLRDIGRRGQGPGEFEYPVKIQITSDNELVVSGSRYLIFFSLEGEYKRRIVYESREGIFTNKAETKKYRNNKKEPKRRCIYNTYYSQVLSSNQLYLFR